MAQGAANRRGKKQNNYFDFGNKGRVTGTEVPDTGNRDENGLELPEDFFPPTAKTVRTEKERRKSNATNLSSESMDIVISSGPTPGEALTGRSTRYSKTPLPARGSPFKKTSLGATPKRISVGPASPSKAGSTPEQTVSSERTTTRKLYFGQGDPPSATSSPERGAPLLSAQPSRRNRNVYSLSQSPERPRGATDGGGLADDTTQIVIPDIEDEEDEVQVNGTAEDDFVPPMEDDGLDALDGEHEGENDIDPDLETRPYHTPVHSSPSANRTIRRTPGQSRTPVQNDTNGADQSVAHASGGSRSSQKRTAVEAELPISLTPPKRRGRPRKDQTQAESSSQAAKKNKGGRPKKTDTEARPRLTNGDTFHHPGATRPMQRARHETPGDGDVQRSRYGRITYQPLEYWRGEHTVYKRHERAASVEEIVRMEDVTPMKRPFKAGRRKKPRATVFEDAEVDPDDFQEDWELGDGIVVGPVKNWDAITGSGGQEVNEAEIAFSANRIDPRDVAEAKFRYAKTLTMPFFGSGVVELPPGGFKNSKNSKKMLLVFFVFYGKVSVDVAGTRFTITKGGQWHVPRGNFYSLRNETEKPARCFFAQGCEVAPVVRTNDDDQPETGG